MPLVTYVLVAINTVVFACETRQSSARALDAFVDRYALIPYDLTHAVSLAPPAPPTVLTLVTSQFLHASVLHLFFNMLFLVVFGPAIEALCGSLRFAGFYLVCGIVGNLAQVGAAPGSHVPGIGASGAIAGVLGAYLVRHPLEPVGTLVPVGCFPLFLRLPAVLVIGLWAAIQFVHGFALTPGTLSERGGGIAYFAHIGGLCCGIVTVGFFEKARRRKGPRARVPHR